MGEGIGHARDTVLFAGHAKLPQNAAPIGGHYAVLVELEVDCESEEVLNVAVTGLPPLGVRLLKTLLQGRRMSSGPSAVVEQLERRYFAPVQRAAMAAVSNAFDAYLLWQGQEKRSEAGKTSR